MSIASAFVRLLMHAIVIERYWLRQVGRDMTKCVACVLLRRRHRAWRGAGTAGTSNNRVQASPGHLEVGAGTAGIGFYWRRHATPNGASPPLAAAPARRRRRRRSQSCRIFSRQRVAVGALGTHPRLLICAPRFAQRGTFAEKKSHSSDAEPRRRRRVRAPRAGRSRTHLYIFAR